MLVNIIKRIIRKSKVLVKHCYVGICMKNGFGKKMTISIADMFYLHVQGKEFIRPDMIVRYLAVLDYYNECIDGISGMELYRKMQNARNGMGYADSAEKRFKKLIESYQKNGYDSDSRIVVDKQLSLKDGSHRLALGIYYREKNINILSLRVEDQIKDYSIDWFYQNGFSNYEIDEILSIAEKLKKRLEINFTGVIWAPAEHLKTEILSDLKRFGTVLDVKTYSYSEPQYENIVRKIYSIDDIAEWKIEKKLEHMKECMPQLTVFHIIFEDPMFRIKESSNMPISRTVERTKKNIRLRYREKIDNYFFDTILHIADNEIQSRFMDCVVEPGIHFAEFVEELNHCDYAFVKTDVPYMPGDFPAKIPVGKDADIICKKDEFEDIKKIALRWAEKHSDYDIRCLDNTCGTHIRLERCGRLFFQIDLSWKIPDLNQGFVEEAIQNRNFSGRFYILSPKYEWIVRFLAYNGRKSKEYHLSYLREHKSDFDELLVKKFLPEKMCKEVMKRWG